jgi:deoxyribodipyrimidine photo-lyase
MKLHTSLVWFRRDCRCFDHAALHHALMSSKRVYCCFIFDNDILSSLPRQDRRLEFIHASVVELERDLRLLGGHLLVRQGRPAELIPALAAELGVQAVFANRDYEPSAIARDAEVAAALEADGRSLRSSKDQVIFEQNEILTLAGTPFSVFTPYKNAWLKRLLAEPQAVAPWEIEAHAGALVAGAERIPALQELGFEPASLPVPPGASGASTVFEDFLPRIADYRYARDFPAIKGPSYLSTHLRFGTTSIRYLVRTVQTMMTNGAGGDGAATWLSELIWREFYAMILFQNPHVVGAAFKPAYDAIEWEAGPEAEALFAAWCEGRTGYPLVDAAMLQLNQTGYMHNRLRMVAASFLVKDLGIDWRWGEQYFALLLNDFELASNNGGWQWAASTGCDAQPYFRIFNPVTQSEKFDPEGKFIKRYLPQLAKLDKKSIHAPWLHGGAPNYPAPIVDHGEARQKTLARFAVVKQAATAP